MKTRSVEFVFPPASEDLVPNLPAGVMDVSDAFSPTAGDVIRYEGVDAEFVVTKREFVFRKDGAATVRLTLGLA